MRMFIVLLALLAVASAPVRAQNVAADYEMPCDDGDANCKASLAQFRKWFPRAMRGDYQGQRNVAFCLSTGCDSAVILRPITGCAWRIVILSSGSLQVDQSDTLNFKTYCGKLDEIERKAATAQANTLLTKIIGKR